MIIDHQAHFTPCSLKEGTMYHFTFQMYSRITNHMTLLVRLIYPKNVWKKCDTWLTSCLLAQKIIPYFTFPHKRFRKLQLGTLGRISWHLPSKCVRKSGAFYITSSKEDLQHHVWRSRQFLLVTFDIFVFNIHVLFYVSCLLKIPTTFHNCIEIIMVALWGTCRALVREHRGPDQERGLRASGSMGL